MITQVVSHLLRFQEHSFEPLHSVKVTSVKRVHTMVNWLGFQWDVRVYYTFCTPDGDYDMPMGELWFTDRKEIHPW